MSRLVRLRAESRHEIGCSTGIKRLTKKPRVVETSAVVQNSQRGGLITSMSVKIYFALGVDGITKESIESEEKSMLESGTSPNEGKENYQGSPPTHRLLRLQQSSGLSAMIYVNGKR